MKNTDLIPGQALLPFENGTNHLSGGGFEIHLSGQNLKGSGYIPAS